MKGRVLVVAGSDCSGGAGIQADIKSITALDGYAATAIVALTAQNTLGVFGVIDVPVDFIRQQIDLIVDDIGVDAIKTGMLSKPETIDCLIDAINAKMRAIPLVVDPVIAAKGGGRLLADDALIAMKERLLPLASLVTPNIPEAEMLLGGPIASVQDMIDAAKRLLTLGPKAVLLKGGHMEGDDLTDVLVAENGVELFLGHRIKTRHTHGTGCSLASSIATGLSQGLTLSVATARARDYVRIAIETAPGFGGGHGPLNHAHTVQDFSRGAR